ncbi:unnamed protein product [Zymoseptoria tritici ST99CH_1E4]|uniref:Uncharacterized protein n=1 Tax=Zymoseptoria tritici ST99CH_1E4 TaxID=1276532 RepID=A0A2H1FN77_ZYMTR|nr:unnamed protein product [Zymoseptoria tritici ST99CH_1E4]
MPNKDTPINKPSSSEGRGGFRNLFSKIFSRHDHDNESHDPARTNPERREFVPRHANRDMLLAVPVEQRPDMIKRARESRRQTMAEMGFSTAPQSFKSLPSQWRSANSRQQKSTLSKSEAGNRLSYPQRSSQRARADTLDLGAAPTRTASVNVGMRMDRTAVSNVTSSELGSTNTGWGGQPTPPRTGRLLQDDPSRRRQYFSHSTDGDPRKSNGKGKQRATEDEVRVAMLREQARAGAMRYPNGSSASMDQSPAPPMSTPVQDASAEPAGRWSRNRHRPSESAGHLLDQIKEDHQNSRPISSIGGSATTSNAESVISYAETEASTAATTIGDQHSERDYDRHGSGEDPSLRAKTVSQLHDAGIESKAILDQRESLVDSV